MTADVLIVGGGSAGLTLATRLSENPSRQVVVLEAGPDLPADDPAHLLSTISFATTGADWGLRAAISGDRVLDYPQGRCVGGGSTVNGALAIRGDRADFERWDSPSWTWEHMLAAYRRQETDLDYGETEVHGGAGPVPIVRWHELVDIQLGLAEAARHLGFPWVDDHNQPGTTGIGPFPMNRRDGRRMSTALTYLSESVRRRPNLQVRSGVRVARVLLAGGRATGVELGDGSVLPAGEVVLSGGSIQSPSLLWRSGLGPAVALARLGLEVAADLPGVGANLHDHPGVFYFVVPGARTTAPTEPQFQIGARYTSEGSPDENDMFLSMMNFWDLSGSPDFQAQLGVPAVVVLTVGVHQPYSRGSIRLTSSDPTVPPEVSLHMLDHPADVARLVEGVRRCAALAADPALGEFLGAPVMAGLDLDDDDAVAGYVRSVVAPWYHPVGTCAIGPVVADDLSVHGAEGLRVVDASIMPTITRAPTNLTAIAIAERASLFFD